MHHHSPLVRLALAAEALAGLGLVTWGAVLLRAASHAVAMRGKDQLVSHNVGTAAVVLGVPLLRAALWSWRARRPLFVTQSPLVLGVIYLALARGVA